VPGAICVLTRESLRHPEEIFSFFLENAFEYVAFNLEEVENVHTVSSVTATDASGRPSVVEEYRDFVSRLYEVWRPHAGTINVREFRDLFASFKNILTDEEYCARPLETADIGIITIQKNGEITAFSPEFAGGESAQFGNFVVGNIRDGSLASILGNRVFLSMRDDIREGVKNCQGSCVYFALCGGAFTSNKYFENGSLKSTETVTCRLHLQALASVLLEKLAVRPDSHNGIESRV
jgi:uncharacterized protein